MCGISGIYNLKRNDPISGEILDRMLEAIAHRGPDGKQVMVFDRIGLGFNRLSFLDLKGGMQPLLNEDRDIVMACNGEIYNYRELREELMAKGHVFTTKTDVEVCLHLYEELGEEFPKKLNGQFAIALYDMKEEKLLLVRDQTGICPLFYTLADGRVIFASEIKGILEYPGIERRLNLKAVDQLMNFPGVVAPNTFFKNIYSMRAGHMLRILPGKEPVDIEYWDMIYPAEEPEDKGEKYYVEKLRDLLEKAISRRLIADVPIGFYISGGLDSSVVSCYISEKRLLTPDQKAYTFSAEIRSENQNDKTYKALDESRFQQMVKDRVTAAYPGRFEHSSVVVNEDEIWQYLPKVIYHAEAAVKESYDVAAFLLSDLVMKSDAKAVLTGQGSDEFFCGYAGYTMDPFRKLMRSRMTKEELESNELLWGDPYFRFERIHPEIRKIHETLYSSDVRSEIGSFSAISTSPVNVERLKGLSDPRRRSYIDYKLRLSDHLLGEHGDRMVSAHSVEGRHPFLDAEILDFMTTVPDEHKIKGTNEKYLLKRAAEGIVPDEILKRKKFPFQAPGMSAMTKSSGAEKFLDEAFFEKVRAQGVFDVDQVRRMKELYSSDGFRLMGAYEIDYLLIVLTVTMLCETYHMTL